MLSFEEAYRIVMDSALETGSERIPFIGTDGRVLAEDIESDIDMPPFNRSAVDGYACRRSDLDAELEVVEILPAGKYPQKSVGKNQCSKIMTGAIVPDGCDVVIMVEEASCLPSGKVRFTGTNPKSNISLRAEDVKRGEIVLSKGKLIKPQDIAVLASVGHTGVLVRKMTEVGIISTGDELVEPEEKPEKSKIRNSNAYQLLSQVMRAGGKGRYYGIAPDFGDAIYNLIIKALGENDIVILTGGVSMGDFDFVPDFLRKAGVNILFDRVNVQPGKPTTFGVTSKTIVFGLPGNPVSAFIQFETMVRPLMSRMMGSEWSPIVHNLPLGVAYERKSAARMGWIPVSVSNMEAIPVNYHGSAHIASLSGTDGIFPMMPGIKSVSKGEIVSVRYI